MPAGGAAKGGGVAGGAAPCCRLGAWGYWAKHSKVHRAVKLNAKKQCPELSVQFCRRRGDGSKRGPGGKELVICVSARS